MIFVALYFIGVLIGILIARVLYLRGFFLIDKSQNIVPGKNIIPRNEQDDCAINAMVIGIIIWPLALFLVLCYHIGSTFIDIIDNKVCHPLSKLNVKDVIRNTLKEDKDA